MELAGTYNEDMKEKLYELVRKLEAGEKIEDAKKDDNSNLPDGYMEALEMFMKAEDFRINSRPQYVLATVFLL